MTTEATQDQASQEKDNIEALFEEAAGGAPSNEGSEQKDQPAKQEEATDSKSDLDLPQNAVKSDASDAEGSQKEGADEGADTATDASKEEKPADWRANLTPEAKAEVERLEEDHRKLLHRARSDAGRVAALTRRVEELARASKKTGSAATEETEALLSEFDKTYPDIAKAVRAQVEEAKKQAANATQLASELARQRAAEEAAKRHAAVEAAHKGWLQTIKTPQFREWYGAQPEEIRALGGSDEPEHAIALLDAYRETHPATSSDSKEASKEAAAATQEDKPASGKTAAEIKAEREKKLAASAGIQTKGASRESTNSGPADNVEQAFDFYAAKKARASSR